VPPCRQADDEQTRVAARLEHALLARLRQQRLGRDAEDALHGERAVRQQAARVAPALLGDGSGTCQTQRRTVGMGKPGAELDRSPVVLGSSERNEDRALAHPTRDEQRDVAGGVREDRGELHVGHSFGQQLVGSIDEQELDVELGRESSKLLTGCRRCERGRAGRHTARLEPGPALLEPGRRGAKLCRVRHDVGQDHDARQVSHERLRHRQQRVGPGLVRDRNENRPLGGLPRNGCFQLQRGVLPEDRPFELLESRTGLDSELVHEHSAGSLVGLQRLRLPAGAIQRRHQIPPQAFAERVLGDQFLELPDQLVLAAECEVGVDS
jgi:hypothetical protein